MYQDTFRDVLTRWMPTTRKERKELFGSEVLMANCPDRPTPEQIREKYWSEHKQEMESKK